MAVMTVNRTERTAFWQILLSVVGVAAVAAGAVLEIVLLSYHSTSTVVKAGTLTASTTVSTTGPAAPSASLVTTCVGIGAALILAAAFFGHINKVILPGGYELDLDNGAKIAAAIATRTSDPAVAAELYKRVAPRAAEMTGAAPTTVQMLTRSIPPLPAGRALDAATISGLLDDAAR
jgi:hypothetical protein